MPMQFLIRIMKAHKPYVLTRTHGLVVDIATCILQNYLCTFVPKTCAVNLKMNEQTFVEQTNSFV
jgi:hypothetical protein